MDDLCVSCLCEGRNLKNISGTKLHELYIEILNEPVNKIMESFLRLCWECQAIINRFQNFKNQSQRCYAELLHYINQNPKHNIVKPSHLKVYNVSNISITSDDYTHCEPKTFVESIHLKKALSKVKLKKAAKQRPKKHVTRSKSELTEDVEMDPLCAKSVQLYCNYCKNTFETQIDMNNHTKKCDPKLMFAPKIKLEVAQLSSDINEIDHEDSFISDPSVELKSHEPPEKHIEVMFAPKIKLEAGQLSSDISEVDHEDSFISDPSVELKSHEPPEKHIEVTYKEKIKKELNKTNLDITMEVHDTSLSDVIPGISVKLNDIQEKPRQVKQNGTPKLRNQVPLPEKPECEECGKKFSSRKTYRYHMNVLHKGQNRYPCPRCGKVYQWKSNLGRHMRSHKALDMGELYCDICDKKFASVATFRQHLRSSRKHVSETDFSFMCNECGKKFVNKTRLRDHIDWEHLNKIKFKCKLCNKPFKCHTSLYVHVQNVHRDREKKDNLCHVCGKSYQNAAKLRYHIVAMHTTETPYRCERCDAAFGWYSSLYRHVREVHHKVKLQPKRNKKTKKVDLSE